MIVSTSFTFNYYATKDFIYKFSATTLVFYFLIWKWKKSDIFRSGIKEDVTKLLTGVLTTVFEINISVFFPIKLHVIFLNLSLMLINQIVKYGFIIRIIRVYELFQYFHHSMISTTAL